MEKIYFIIPTEEITEDLIINCSQSSVDSVRKSLDGSKGIVKIPKGSIPSELSSYDALTHEEIKAILADVNEGWFDPNAED